jgi:hypothetical protein
MSLLLLVTLANINTVAANIANVNTDATNVANVNTVAGISADVTTVAGKHGKRQYVLPRTSLQSLLHRLKHLMLLLSAAASCLSVKGCSDFS